jgi:hypothetical protein
LDCTTTRFSGSASGRQPLLYYRYSNLVLKTYNTTKPI